MKYVYIRPGLLTYSQITRPKISNKKAQDSKRKTIIDILHVNNGLKLMLPIAKHNRNNNFRWDKQWKNCLPTDHLTVKNMRLTILHEWQLTSCIFESKIGLNYDLGGNVDIGLKRHRFKTNLKAQALPNLLYTTILSHQSTNQRLML